MKTVSITTAELRDILSRVVSACPVGFTSLTDVKLKPGAPFKEVRKLSRVQAFAAFDYGRSIGKQAEREGVAMTHVVQPRKWGTRIAPALVENKGSYYLPAKVERASAPIYMARDGELMKVIAQSAIEPYLIKTERPDQGIEKPVIYRDYKLESISKLSIGGCRYAIQRSSSVIDAIVRMAKRRKPTLIENQIEAMKAFDPRYNPDHPANHAVHSLRFEDIHPTSDEAIQPPI